MIKIILLILLALTLQTEATSLQERKITKKPNFIKQIVRCPNGMRSFILTKDGLYYSDKYKKFLFEREAGRDSCKKKHLYSKKNAVVCMQKEDMYHHLIDTLHHSKKTKLYGSCLKLKRSVPLKVIDHFPFTSRITYYEVSYKGKKFYISSKSLSKTQRYRSNRLKKRHLKKRSKKRVTKYHKKYNKYKHKKKIKKHLYKNKNRIKHRTRSIENNHNYTYNYPKNIPLKNNNVTDTPTLDKTYENNIKNISYESPSVLSKINNKQYYTYRCVGIYGDNRITVDNDTSMSDASDSVWRRCQALKGDDETCKITDCYKLIK